MIGTPSPPMRRICRTSPVVVLVSLVLTLLLLFPSNTLPDELSSDTSEHSNAHGRCPLPTTATVTATSTLLIDVPRPPPPARPPGPAFCDVCGTEDAMCTLYGDHNLARSRVYEGTNTRFRRVIANALAGKPTKIGVLGGSVTTGQGLKNHPVENWTSRFLAAWKELFPASETTLTNGAVAATGSDYLSTCFKEHVDEDVDLIIVELFINDQRIQEAPMRYEWLLRGLLALPKGPAVINLNTMGLSFEHITTGGDLHTPVAEYYDVPTVSLRNMLVAHVLKHPELDEHYFANFDSGMPDWRHVNAHGHKAMADILVAYTQRQLCVVARHQARPPKYSNDDGKLPGTDALDTIPRLRMFQKYDRETVTGPVRPWCQSTRTQKHPLAPISSKGWRPWAAPGRSDKSYLIATEPGATIKFAVVAALMGRVRITHLRSRTFGLGDALCWLDDDRAHATRVVSWWEHEEFNLASVATVAENASPGAHVLTCEVMRETTDPGGGREFRIIAVDAT